MKFRNKENLLIAISSLRKIIDIFFGPFLVTYFIKTSTDSLIDLSIYNILVYFFLGVLGFIIGYIVRNKFQIGMFRFGVILNFVYILFIIILKEAILDNLLILAFISGIALIAYWFPYNLFISLQVKNKNRESYEVKRKTISLITSVLTPILLGSLITTTDFYLTAIIIAIISGIQIILSFFIKPEEKKDYKFTPLKSYKTLIKNKNIFNIFIVEIFIGMNISDGVLNVLLTILIFNAFKTDLNLGIISSLSSILTIILSYIYSKKCKNKSDKMIILLCGIVPVISVLLLVFNTNNITLIIYYMIYNCLINILSMIIDIRLFNISNSDIVKQNHNIEFWSIREFILNLSRIIGYSLLLLTAIFNKHDYLNYLLIIITLSIPIMAYFTTKVERK